MTRERSITEQIALVERKLDLRRRRTVRHLGEARASVQRATAWLPLLGVLGVLFAGMAAGRRGHASAPAAGPVARTGIFATLLAVGATAARLAMSPAGRALWATLQSARKPPVR